MEIGTYKLHRRALAALNQLAGDERVQVLETLAALVDASPARWGAAQVKKLPGEESLYLVRINDSLRAIVRAPDGQEPEVMDIVRHETLAAFTNVAGRNGD